MSIREYIGSKGMPIETYDQLGNPIPPPSITVGETVYVYTNDVLVPVRAVSINPLRLMQI